MEAVTFALIVYFVLSALCVYGYIKNIVSLFGMFKNGGHGLMYIVRVIGIFCIPVGVVLGWFW